MNGSYPTTAIYTAASRIVAVITAVMTVGVSLAVTAAQPPLATKGDKLRVDRLEAQSAAFFSSPEQQERLRGDPTQWRPVAEEALTVAEWMQSPLRAALTPAELAAVNYRTRLADIRAGVDALVQRDLARLRSDVSIVESRARELWQADDGKYFTPTLAQVNLLFIDAHKRGLSAATARYQQAARRLKRGEPFARVAKDLADIVPGQKVQLSLPMTVELRSIEGAARRAIFRDLKIGDISAPIPTPEGWVVAQVLEIKKPERQPFDAVKQPLMEQILTEASATARLAIMATLSEPPVVYSKELQPNPELERNARAAGTAASQLAQEMGQRNMTPADVQRRLEELLALAKQPPPTLEAPPPPLQSERTRP